jgi:nitric oxide synthase-interacting protein
MYESILQQKQAIQHEQKMLEQKSLELDQQKQLEELEAKRVILDTFDKTQNSMLGNRKRPTIKDDLQEDSKKRKLDTTDEQELEKTTKQLRKEKEEASKPKIGSFWVPSVTPQADASALKAVKTQVICSASEETHPLSIKSLIDVKFETENTKDKKKVCPACLKSLTNASKLSGKRSKLIYMVTC